MSDLVAMAMLVAANLIGNAIFDIARNWRDRTAK